MKTFHVSMLGALAAARIAKDFPEQARNIDVKLLKREPSAPNSSRQVRRAEERFKNKIKGRFK